MKTCMFAIASLKGLRYFESPDSPMGRLVAEEVLKGKSYPLAPIAGPVKTIVDVGANVGAASVYFAVNYPDATVHAFEPDAAAFSLLEKNVDGLRIFPKNFGLSNKHGLAKLYPGRQDSVTSSMTKNVLTADQAVDVSLANAASVMRQLGIEEIDILKVDTEGCEVPILESLDEWLHKTAVVYVEYHDAFDREMIDDLLNFSHVLWRGSITDPNRGELCYVNTDRLPKDLDWDKLRITRE